MATSPAPSWLRPNDRVLITGVSGWFGKTLSSMLKDHRHVLAFGSSRDAVAMQWDFDLVEQFQPTVVANFAFITRNRLHDLGRSRFIEENSQLIDRFCFALSQDSVRIGITISSGAAAAPEAQQGLASQEIYGALKLREEVEALELRTSEKTVVVARAYSVSGPFVRRIHDYAFSDLVSQAITGDITVLASQPVFRRYASVADLLTVAFRLGDRGFSGVIESGGELIEMYDLARLIRNTVNKRAHIHRPQLASMEPSIYASDNRSWVEGCENAEFKPMSLLHQVKAVEAYLRSL